MLPSLVADGMLERPRKMLLIMAAQLEAGDAQELDIGQVEQFEQALLGLSSAVGDRYFLKGANAAPTMKLDSLA